MTPMQLKHSRAMFPQRCLIALKHVCLESKISTGRVLTSVVSAEHKGASAGLVFAWAFRDAGVVGAIESFRLV
jgi:hypothetical protein